MVNIRNALILSDIKLLYEKQSDSMKGPSELRSLGLISQHLVDEILREITGLRDMKKKEKRLA